MLQWKDTPDEWLHRIDEALRFRQHFSSEKNWKRLEELYMNKNTAMGPNLIQEMYEALEARLHIPNPKIRVYPSLMDPRSINSAPIVETIDNWLLGEMGIQETIMMSGLHSYLWSRGIIKIGYDSEWGYDPQLDLGRLGSIPGMTLSQFSRAGMRLEYGKARPGLPWVAPVLPHDFVVPYGTKDIDTAPWCAHRVFRHIDLFRADPKYEKTRKLEPNLSMSDVMNSYRRNNRFRKGWSDVGRGNALENPEFVELWEIRNTVTGRIVVISDNEVHRNEPDLLQVEGLPFVSFSFVKHPYSFWSTPQAAYLEAHQAEQTDIALQASKQRRLNTLKFLYAEGAMDREELEKALSSQVGVGVKVKNTMNLDEVIKPMQQSSNFQLYQDAEFSRRNARQAIGFSSNQMGEFDASSRRTATEASMVARGSSLRTDLRLNTIAQAYIDIIKKVNQVVFTFWKSPRYIRIGKDQWPKFTGDEIKAEYDYKLGIGVDNLADPMNRQQFAMQMYQMLAMDPLVAPDRLRDFLVRNFGDAEFNNIFRTPEENAAVSVQMQQMQQRTNGAQ